MRPQDLIKRKRDNGELPADAIREFLSGVADGSIPDYQTAALLMAIYWRGMSPQELSVWTEAMIHSGKVVDLSEIPGIKVDKHSTGGVGDKVSICLAPLVAACGVPVPMISGRGLGHSGGTLDKLEAIPNFSTRLEIAEFVAVIKQAGLALIGQTDELAPADRKLYSLRDVTGTVESIPLIASSIMSKKLAEGIDALVLDVKVGSGAFMKDIERARSLAQTIIGIGTRAGKQVIAAITDMNQPLGREIGNANETREAIDILRGEGPDDLWQVTRTLGVEMLLAGGISSSPDDAATRLEQARADGTGLETLRHCVELQGGDASAIDNPKQRLPTARHHRTVHLPDGGYLARIDTEQVGIAAMLLGAGRRRVDDRIDHGVGITMQARLGDKIAATDGVAELAYNDEDRSRLAERALVTAFELSSDPPDCKPLVYEVIR